MHALLMTLALLLPASPVEADAPAIYQGDHFYNAIGTPETTIEATATPTELHLTEAIAYTITVRRVRNPSRVIQPDFYKLREFGVSFATYPKDITKTIDGDTVTFQWKMRPRTVEETQIPGLRFDYYLPEAAEGRQLRTKYVDPIPIVVHPKKPIVQTKGDWFLQPVEESDTVSYPPGRWHWSAIPLVLVPLTALAIIHWHRRHPDEGQWKNYQQRREMQAALAAIQTAENPDAIASVLRTLAKQQPENEAVTTLLRRVNALRFGRPVVTAVEPILELRDAATQAVLSTGQTIPTESMQPLAVVRYKLGCRTVLTALAVFLPLVLLFILQASPDPLGRDEGLSPGRYVNEARAMFANGDRVQAVFHLREGLRSYPFDDAMRYDLGRMQQELGAGTTSVRWCPASKLWWQYGLAWPCAVLLALGVFIRFTTMHWTSPGIITLAAAGLMAVTWKDIALKSDASYHSRCPFCVVSETGPLYQGNAISYETVTSETARAGEDYLVFSSPGMNWLMVKPTKWVESSGWLPRTHLQVSP